MLHILAPLPPFLCVGPATLDGLRVRCPLEIASVSSHSPCNSRVQKSETTAASTKDQQQQGSEPYQWSKNKSKHPMPKPMPRPWLATLAGLVVPKPNPRPAAPGPRPAPPTVVPRPRLLPWVNPTHSVGDGPLRPPPTPPPTSNPRPASP
jgi:hypothetical protein